MPLRRSQQQDFLLRRVECLRRESCELKADQAKVLDDVTLRLQELKESNLEILEKLNQYGIHGVTTLASSELGDDPEPEPEERMPAVDFISLDRLQNPGGGAITTDLELLRQGPKPRDLRPSDLIDMIAKGSSSAEASAPTGSGTTPPTLARGAEANGITMDEIRRLEEGIAGLSLTKGNLATIAREQVFLRSLNFPSRRLRHDDIPVAHQRTFVWMLDEPHPEQPRLDGKGPTSAQREPAFTYEESDGDSVQAEDDNDDDRGAARFPAWLREGDGIFWVSGKAGAGKSTLIKFVADHPDTRKMLEQWAGSKKLSIAAHYFWSAGTTMQKSQKGLLQTLLYDIFRGCPGEVPVICPEQWQQTFIDTSSGASGLAWTVSELLAALRAVAKARDLGVRYCIFVDGVDEFEGDHFDLCQMLKELSTSPNLKLCLSSRPWNVFEDAFGADPDWKLYVHTLTRSDILAYSHSRLAEHPRWRSNMFKEVEMTSLVNHIADKAQGVFLWVFLVTRSLRDGMTNGDTIADLQRRLLSLPTDLERFFRSMLAAIDPLYGDKMAQTLTMAANARQPLHYLHFCMHEHAYEDEDYVLKRAGAEAQALDLEVLRDQCQRRINARCGGLLELKGATVEFLHRTVRDFLFTREMSDYLAAKCGGRFLVNVSTLATHVALIERGVRAVAGRLDGRELLAGCMAYVADALDESQPKAMALLDVLNDAYLGQELCGAAAAEDGALPTGLELDLGRDDIFARGTNFRNDSATSQLRALFLSAGVDNYVATKLHESPCYFDDCVEPPLEVVMAAPQWSARHCRIVGMLLGAGHDPNGAGCIGTSPWEQFIWRTCAADCRGDDGDTFRMALDNSLFSLFIKHGAQTDIRLSGKRDKTFERMRGERGLEGTKEEEPRTPAVFFVNKLLSHGDAYLSAQAAMAALRDFLSCHPGGGGRGGSSHEEDQPRGEHIIAPREDLRDLVVALRVNLERLQVCDAKSQSAMRLRFYAGVTGAIVEAGLRQGEDLSALLPAIQAVFPRSLGGPLARMVLGHQSLGDRDSSCGSAARRERPYDADGEAQSFFTLSRKRAKLDGAGLGDA